MGGGESSGFGRALTGGRVWRAMGANYIARCWIVAWSKVGKLERVRRAGVSTGCVENVPVVILLGLDI